MTLGYLKRTDKKLYQKANAYHRNSWKKMNANPMNMERRLTARLNTLFYFDNTKEGHEFWIELNNSTHE